MTFVICTQYGRISGVVVFYNTRDLFDGHAAVFVARRTSRDTTQNVRSSAPKTAYAHPRTYVGERVERYVHYYYTAPYVYTPSAWVVGRRRVRLVQAAASVRYDAAGVSPACRLPRSSVRTSGSLPIRRCPRRKNSVRATITWNWRPSGSTW